MNGGKSWWTKLRRETEYDSVKDEMVMIAGRAADVQSGFGVSW